MPTHRTCTCTYHNQMKIALEDAARSYNDLHSKCGGEGGCACEHCVDGKCKTESPFASYAAIEKRVLCTPPPGRPIGYACAMGQCERCGFFEQKEIEVTKSEAQRLIFSKDGVFESIDPEKCKQKGKKKKPPAKKAKRSAPSHAKSSSSSSSSSEEEEEQSNAAEEPKALEERFGQAGISPGCRIALVDRVRCVSAADYNAELPKEGEKATLRFWTTDYRADRAELAFAR